MHLSNGLLNALLYRMESCKINLNALTLAALCLSAAGILSTSPCNQLIKGVIQVGSLSMSMKLIVSKHSSSDVSLVSTKTSCGMPGVNPLAF